MPKPRKSSILVPKKTMKIFCEGEKTEPYYIEGYLQTHGDPERKTVVKVQETRKNTPIQLVEVAIKAKMSDSTLPDDEFWVVYDRESVAKYPDALHAEARRKAEGKGIKIALSNVCFEYWLLIHFIDTQAPYDCYDDLRKNSRLNAEVRSICGKDYEKSSDVLFGFIKDLIPRARARGFALNKQGRANANKARDKEHHINPYMGMVDLLDAIDVFR